MTIVIAYYITKPYLMAIFTGAIISYLAYPLYTKICKHIPNKSAAALLISAVIVLLIVVPLIIVISMVTKEAFLTYTAINQEHLGSNFMKVVCKDESNIFCTSLQELVNIFPDGNVDFYIQTFIKKMTSFILENASRFIVSLLLLEQQ